MVEMIDYYSQQEYEQACAYEEAEAQYHYEMQKAYEKEMIDERIKNYYEICGCVNNYNLIRGEEL